MDCEAGMCRIILYSPTELIQLAFKFKHVPYLIARRERARLAELSGPAVEFQTDLVVSETAVLGWLDKRYPYPELFPSEPSIYGKAATLAYAMTQDPSVAQVLWANQLTKPNRFLTGNAPNIADLMLYQKLFMIKHPAAKNIYAEVMAWADR